MREAEIAVELGYHAGLLSVAALRNASEDELIDHCRRVAEKIPIFGFYLQRAVGGIPLSENFWRRFSQIENVVGIKIAPFDRYRTLDVVRGVVAAGAEERVTLYTGNDDHIVLDLLTPFIARRDDRDVTVRIRGACLDTGASGPGRPWTCSSAASAPPRRGLSHPNCSPSIRK